MSQSENKPKLSDVARQTTADKAKRFSSTMIPAPPKPKEPATDQAEKAQAQVPATPIAEAPVAEQPVAPVVTAPDPSPAPARVARPRRGGAMSIEDVISHDPPKGESYPNQIRVSAKHHKLLRKLAFTHEVTINHVMYNLLDLLEQADQRDQQKGD